MGSNANYSENDIARDELLHNCSPRCPNGTAASRDFIARIIRRASETDLNNGSKRFVNRHALVNDLNTQTVLSLLNSYSRSKIEDDSRTDQAAAYISPELGQCRCGKPRCTGARVIFVVLSLIAREEHAWDLAGNGICDGDLPFYIRENSIVSCENESRHLEVMQAWTPEEKRLFCHFQWAMLSPYFARKAVPNIEVETFPIQVCLPWCEYEDPWKVDGTPRIITSQFDPRKTIIKKVKISRNYHDLDDEDGYFALKGQRLRATEWRTFKDEVAGNNRTSASHANITPLLAAFDHAGLRYMLFPWAEGGSLDAFWERHTAPPQAGGPKWRTSTWIWNQCSGLADALSFLHGYHAVNGKLAVPQWHADIQPRNILCSRTTDGEDGLSYILQISDFEFSTEFETSDSEIWVEDPYVAAFHHPPELRMIDENETARVTLKWDVWCLGCVYLELLSWFAYGYRKGVEQFAKERKGELYEEELALIAAKVPTRREETFFRLVVTEDLRPWLLRWIFRSHRVTVRAEVRPVVLAHYERLKEWWDRDRMIGLTSLIKDDMLITEVDKRATSKSVRQFFVRNSLDGSTGH